ncbi:MAG TPA: SURF1 family protein [Stellaceae bacterium]|jgi:surfeit locus 1 family protein
MIWSAHVRAADRPAGIGGFRPRLWPTVVAVPIVLLCLGLGVWQVQRLSWKEGLIAARAAAVAAPAVPAPQSAAQAHGLEYHHVTDKGVFLNDKENFLAAISAAGQSGFQVLTPLREAGGRIVFINRGFVPAALKNRDKRAAGEPTGTVRIAGLLRLPRDRPPNWFVPDNRPDLNYWFWVDLPAMAEADGLHHVASFYIDAGAAPNPGGWPKGGVTRLALPNHHLQYAITWFSLVVAMIVIYVVFHRRNAERG